MKRNDMISLALEYREKFKSEPERAAMILETVKNSIATNKSDKEIAELLLRVAAHAMSRS